MSFFLEDLPAYYLETQQLQLRSVSPETYHYLFALDSQEAVMRFFGLKDEEAYRVEYERYEAGLTSYGKSFFYFQLLNKNSQELLGWCGYHLWMTRHNRAEIGYELFDAANRGKGLMTEAIGPILEFGFNELGLNRVEAYTSKENTASQRVLLKAGFEKEGLLKSHYLKNGVYEDSVVFGLVRPE